MIMKNLESELAQKGINPTAMRLLVFQILKQREIAISLTDIESELDKSDRVTIYRTMRTFEEHGLVHRIEDGSGVSKFALCQEGCSAEGHQDLHVHFQCTECNTTHCLPSVQIPAIGMPDGYQTQVTELVMKGVCPNCATKMPVK